jgi:hypothetical protein
MMCAGTNAGAVSAAQKVIVPVNPSLDAIMDSNPLQADMAAPACPKCSATMVKRQAQKGRHAGDYFWACSTFPLCRQVQEIGEG